MKNQISDARREYQRIYHQQYKLKKEAEWKAAQSNLKIGKPVKVYNNTEDRDYITQDFSRMWK